MACDLCRPSQLQGLFAVSDLLDIFLLDLFRDFVNMGLE